MHARLRPQRHTVAAAMHVLQSLWLKSGTGLPHGRLQATSHVLRAVATAEGLLLLWLQAQKTLWCSMSVAATHR